MHAARGLSAAELLEVVDAGTDGDPAERGRVLLAACGASPEELDGVSLGARDAAVLALRCATLGDTLVSRVVCPACGLRLTVRVPRGHVELAASDAGPVAVAVEAGGFAVAARSPDGAALAAAAACGDVWLARRSLIASCVVSATSAEGEPVEPLALPEDVLEAVGEAIVEAEPMVEVRVPMTCAGCSHEWPPVLDIALFAWRELSAAGAQLLDEVHQLAIGYGWSEAQVLELSSRRRRQYVERLA